jgi:hypothetical protein
VKLAAPPTGTLAAGPIRAPDGSVVLVVLVGAGAAGVVVEGVAVVGVVGVAVPLER